MSIPTDVIVANIIPCLRLGDAIRCARALDELDQDPALWNMLYTRMSPTVRHNILNKRKFVLQNAHKRCKVCESFPTHEINWYFLCVSCMKQSQDYILESNLLNTRLYSELNKRQFERILPIFTNEDDDCIYPIKDIAECIA